MSRAAMTVEPRIAGQARCLHIAGYYQCRNVAASGDEMCSEHRERNAYYPYCASCQKLRVVLPETRCLACKGGQQSPMTKLWHVPSAQTVRDEADAAEKQMAAPGW